MLSARRNCTRHVSSHLEVVPKDEEQNGGFEVIVNLTNNWIESVEMKNLST